MRFGPAPPNGIIVWRGDREEVVAWCEVLAMSLVTPGEKTRWHVVLTSGEVLAGPAGELTYEGTVSPGSRSHRGFISAGIYPSDGGSHTYTGVVFPTDLTGTSGRSR